MPDTIRTVGFVSLGCPKNLVDSEKMLGLLAEEGLIPVSEATEADAIVINTCGFLQAARAEAMEEIRRAAELKRTGRCRRLVVAGCLVQRYGKELLKWCPQIDALVGVFDRDRIVEAVREEHKGKEVESATIYCGPGTGGGEVRAYVASDRGRLRLTPRHYAYLRISEGCNRRCAFCTIPGIRGRMRSKAAEMILAEARELRKDGAVELNLVGQATTDWGRDIGEPEGLAGLLEKLDRSWRRWEGQWIRLLYAHPASLTERIIEAMASAETVVRYIDLPIQHINDEILRRMRRGTSRRHIENLLEQLRKKVPGIAIRTTLISGFPGETEQQHRELVEFVRQARFEALGVFAFSPEPGTLAWRMYKENGGISQRRVRKRVEELMLTQQKIVFERNAEQARRGVEVEVMIEGERQKEAVFSQKKGSKENRPPLPGWWPMADGQGWYYPGRTEGQAPEIDGLTYVFSKRRYRAGEVVRCRITGWRGYDLIAQPVNELERCGR